MKVCLRCKNQFESTTWCCPGCAWTPQVCESYLSFVGDEEQEPGFDERFFQRLSELEEGSFWFQGRNQLVTWAIRKYFLEARSLLEVGCGTGYVLAGIRKEFPNLSMAGSDPFTTALRFAAQRVPGVSLFRMDARRLPFDGEFDVIGAFDVLEHIEEDEAVLSQMFRAVRPGGGLVLTVPQHQFLWSGVDEYSFHRRRYSRAELAGKLERAGFRIARATSFVSLLLPLMLLSRLRYRKGCFDGGSSELTMGRIQNLCLGKILAIERFLIRKDVCFRAGGSLLVVARRAEG